MSFRGFVEALREAAAGGQAAEAPILEEGSDGVRLMTVHKAKGLEFPVVILADITARLTPWDASRYVDAERGLCALRIGGWSPKDSERQQGDRASRASRRKASASRTSRRLARAICSWFPPSAMNRIPKAGWRRSMPRFIRLKTPAACRRRRRVPVIQSKDTVLKRPDGDPATMRTVCPGEHRFGSGDHVSVVWWSPEPSVLKLDAETPSDFAATI